MTLDQHKDGLLALLHWWAAAGVTTAEAQAILDAPTPNPPVRSTNPQPATTKTPAKAPLAPRATGARSAGGSENRANAAQTAAAGADSLAALANAIRAFDPPGSGLTKPRPVLFEGSPHPSVVVLSEAPGREEEAEGRSFAATAATLRDRMLAAIGLSIERDVLSAPMVFWRPPSDRSPTPEDIAPSLPFVERLLALSQPKAILAFGALSAHVLAGARGATMKLRGQSLTFQSKGLTKPINAMVMLHPAYLLRRPQDKRLAWTDLQAAAIWLDALGVSRSPPK